MTKRDREAEKILAELTSLFVRPARKRKIVTHRPRCVDCGRVSKHVRCARCAVKRDRRERGWS